MPYLQKYPPQIMAAEIAPDIEMDTFPQFTTITTCLAAELEEGQKHPQAVMKRKPYWRVAIGLGVTLATIIALGLVIGFVVVPNAAAAGHVLWEQKWKDGAMVWILSLLSGTGLIC
jgi:4-amino-4-deoxy-L-arabinose transferase-like glycosyltransferase